MILFYYILQLHYYNFAFLSNNFSVSMETKHLGFRKVKAGHDLTGGKGKLS